MKGAARKIMSSSLDLQSLAVSGEGRVSLRQARETTSESAIVIRGILRVFHQGGFQTSKVSSHNCGSLSLKFLERCLIGRPTFTIDYYYCCHYYYDYYYYCYYYYYYYSNDRKLPVGSFRHKPLLEGEGEVVVVVVVVLFLLVLILSLLLVLGENGTGEGREGGQGEGGGQKGDRSF